MPTSRRVITETYSSGTDWYRVYSDGWCEQGGFKSKTGSNAIITIDLLKAYTNTDYIITIGQSAATGFGAMSYGNLSENSKSISSFQTYQYNDINIYWITHGYTSYTIDKSNIIKY